MAAPSNESQGLKIAVAAFVSLTVILAVTCYFLYSSYDKAVAQEAAAQEKVRNAQKIAADLQNERDEYRKSIGTRAEEIDPAKAEIKAEQKKLDEKVIGIQAKVDAVVAKAQQSGVTGPDVDQAKNTVKRLVQEYTTEPNKTFLSTTSRLADILENVEVEMTALSMALSQTKRKLEASNSISQESINAQTEATKKAQADLQAEHDDHVTQRGDLLKKVDQYQTEINNQANQIATLTTQIRQNKEDSDKRIEQLLLQIRDLREQVSKNEVVLDVPDGYVTYVDNLKGEIRTNLTRSTGLRPQMSMTIFDKNSPGIPTEKPKGTIEFIWVGDSYSIARITETKSPIRPISVGDIVYSAAWSPNEPMRFALVGKMDMNRDGKDDREDLKRMIRAAGGIVDYDLPPPEAGKESGKLTAKDTWYILDERMPLREVFGKYKEESTENKEFLQKKSEAQREARLNGVRLLPLERLLSYLGWRFTAPVEGRVEAYDANSMKTLTRARQAGAGAKPAGEGAPAEKKAEDNPPDAMDKPDNQ